MDEYADFHGIRRFTPGRNGFTIKYIVIHAIPEEPNQTVYDIAMKFQLDPDFREISHYIIDKMGHVLQCISENDRAPANGIVDVEAEPWFRENAEEQSIAISLVKASPHNLDGITELQKDSLFSLIRRIIRRNPAIRRGRANQQGGIVGHYALAPNTNFNCPGLFSWKELWAAIRRDPVREKCAIV